MVYVFASASVLENLKNLKRLKNKEKSKIDNLPSYEVVIPSKNEELNIDRCLISAAIQTHKPKRIHIINDNSTDRTLDKILFTITETLEGICYDTKEIKSDEVEGDLIICHDKRGIEYFVWNNKKKSIGKGRFTNYLVEKGYIKEPFFLNIDADTRVSPDAAKTILDKIKDDPKVAAAYIYCFSEPEENTKIGKLYNTGFSCSRRIGFTLFRSGAQKLGFHYCLAGYCVMFRTDAYKKHPRPSDTTAGDTAHAWVLQANGYWIKYIPETYAITGMPSRFKSIIKQRINWHSGPFQNLYIRGIETLKGLKKQGIKRFLGGLFCISYYCIFSPLYQIKWGIGIPLLTAIGAIHPVSTLKYYFIDYSVALMFTLYSTYVLRKLGYHRDDTPWRLFKDFNIFYFVFRPIVVLTTTYGAIKTTFDIVWNKIKGKEVRWHGYT